MGLREEGKKVGMMRVKGEEKGLEVYFGEGGSRVWKLGVGDERESYMGENVFEKMILYGESLSFVSERKG